MESYELLHIDDPHFNGYREGQIRGDKNIVNSHEGWGVLLLRAITTKPVGGNTDGFCILFP
jgi:hypothetical protein